MKKIAISLLAVLATTVIAAAEPYTAMLEKLRAEIISKVPTVDASAQTSVEKAADPKARIAAVKKLTKIQAVLASDALDARLAKFLILHEATPAGLAAFAAKGSAQKKAVDALLADEKLMLQIAVADGARPVHGRDSKPARYGRAMDLYLGILKASPGAAKGILQRLALATALEFSETDDDSKAFQRYLHYQKARKAGELDPNFDRLSTWELRFVVCATESDETLAWGREMLRNYRPDHIATKNQGWRYANVVNTDVDYSSTRKHNDRPELMDMQNILMNGGICGRRSFFARYICRAFGIPATARPSKGHGASARWTPKGWIVVLGPGWGSGKSTTRYQSDRDFLATTQARKRGPEFLKVKRAFWIGDIMGEKRNLQEAGSSKTGSTKPFWNGVALATRRQLIEESEAVTLDALGAELGEASGSSVAPKIVTPAGKLGNEKIHISKDGSITIPAATFTKKSEDVITMNSHGDGLQVFLTRFSQQRPILVRGGSLRHKASLCESATRHWRGRRPRKSRDLRGLRLAVTPISDKSSKELPPKKLTLEVADGVTMEFVYIPPGTFTMGGSRTVKAGDILADTPRHDVTLSGGFYLGKYEVTVAQYKGVMSPDKAKPEQNSDHPIDGVKPNNGLLICENISTKTGFDVRLPTEAEWEYAARAGTKTLFHFSDDPATLGDYAWFKDNAGGKTHPVGKKKPNPWGLYDMYGNVAEFVRDEHEENYYANSPKTDPTGPSLGTFSDMEYTLDLPAAGDYILTARIVTANPDQHLKVLANDSKPATNLSMPLTLGRWDSSKTVTISLKKGKNTLHFWRDKAPQYGMALKSFTLKPASRK
jgi:formylglycine-generating enzyme required for sulfatase activity